MIFRESWAHSFKSHKHRQCRKLLFLSIVLLLQGIFLHRASSPSKHQSPEPTSFCLSIVQVQLPRSSLPTSAKMRASASALLAAATSALAKNCSYAGVNIAGLDFGTDTSGSCVVTNAVDPGSAGISQMNHFVKNDGLNVFRLPVSWQYLTNGALGGKLDTTRLATYDTLMQGCLDSGNETMCIIDIHNYARWDGAIIGQGGPSNADFASLWSQLGTYFKQESRITFGVMNEPVSLQESPFQSRSGPWLTSNPA